VELAAKESISLEAVARRLVEEARTNHKRLPGFGHRVHTTDPRTGVLFNMARESGVAGKGIALLEALELQVREKIKPLPINIDGALAAVLHDIGFPPAFGMLVFIIGRVAGLTAEVAEEYAREKPMRIHVPVTYDGVPPREREK
jgi:citrate synthase